MPDLAVASRSATPLQSTTATVLDSPSPRSSALPKLPSLEIAGYKTLRTLSVTGSSSLIHQILTRIASLDLDAVTLVICLSQAKVSAPKPSRPPPPGPTSHELKGTFPSGGSNKGNKKKNKLSARKPSRPPIFGSTFDELWDTFPSDNEKKESFEPPTFGPISDEFWNTFPSDNVEPSVFGPISDELCITFPSDNEKKDDPSFEPSIFEPISDDLCVTFPSDNEKKEKRHFEPPRPLSEKEPHWRDALVRSDPPSIKDTTPITDDRLLALTSRIASQWANSIRVFDMKPFRSTTSFFNGPTNAILSLAPCEGLEVLDFRGWNFGPSLNNTISDLAHSWPKLTSLYFSVDNITIPTLRVLALSCPLLNTLEINISLEDIPPINSTRGYALSHPLKVLSAGDNGTTIQNTKVLLLVARHLNILFPYVKVATHENYNAEQWLQIGEFVEVLQAVRKDDADRGACGKGN